MKWKTDDLSRYEVSKEYIDTALIPVHKVNIDAVGVEAFNRVRHVETVAKYIEEQLMGRVLLLPAVFHYVASQDQDEEENAAAGLFTQYLQKTVFTGQSRSFAHVIAVAGDPAVAEALKSSGTAVFSAFTPDEPTDEDIINMGKNGYQFILDVWKE